MRTGYAIGRDKSVYRPETEQWNMMFFVSIAILLFLVGFSMQALRFSHIRSRAFFHEWGHIFGAYTSGGSAIFGGPATVLSWGGVRWWVMVWGPIGGVLFPMLAWLLCIKIRIPVFGAVLFGMGHGEIIRNYDTIGHEIGIRGAPFITYHIFMVVALAVGWAGLYWVYRRYATGGSNVRKREAIRRNTAVSPGQRRWSGKTVG